MLMLFLLLALFSGSLPGVQTEETQNTGSAQRETHGLYNVYFIPAYRVATNTTLKTPPANAGIVFRAGLRGTTRPKTTTTEKSRISGAASDIYSEQQSLSQAAGPEQQAALPLRTQPSAITQYLLGFRNRFQHYQQPSEYQQYQHPNGYQQPQQPNGYQQPQQPNEYQQHQQPNGYQQQQQYYPIPPGYYPIPTRSSESKPFQGYFPFPSVYIPPSIIPKSATEPPLLPPINLNTGNYRAAASVKDEAVIKSAQISVTPTLATAGPVYATVADEIQTTIKPVANTTVPDVAAIATEENSTNASKKSTTVPPETPKTSAPLTSAPTPLMNPKPSPASPQAAKTSPSPNITKTSEASSTEKAQAEEHQSISRHFEFSEDKEHSQVNATGDIRLTATRKNSMEGEASQNSPPAHGNAAQGLSSAFPTFPSRPLNTPHPHSHPHPAIIQGPNGFFVGTYNPTNAVGVIPPPANNDPYNSYNPFGHSAALSQGGLPVHTTLPTRLDLYYGFAPGYPFGVPPPNNATSQGDNVIPPRPEPQQAEQQAPPPTQPLPLYQSGPRQLFEVAGPRQVPYSLPQQVPYAGYDVQPFQPPGDYSRFSNQVIQPPVGRPFYARDPSLPNGGYEGDTGNAGLPNRLYSPDPSGPTAPSRLYSAEAGALNPNPLLNRRFSGGPPPFLTPGYARSDSVESNSGLTNYVSPVRGIGTAYEVKPGSENILDNYDRGTSSRDFIKADGDSEQVAY